MSKTSKLTATDEISRSLKTNVPRRFNHQGKGRKTGINHGMKIQENTHGFPNVPFFRSERDRQFQRAQVMIRIVGVL